MYGCCSSTRGVVAYYVGVVVAFVIVKILKCGCRGFNQCGCFSSKMFSMVNVVFSMVKCMVFQWKTTWCLQW